MIQYKKSQEKLIHKSEFPNLYRAFPKKSKKKTKTGEKKGIECEIYRRKNQVS